MNASAADIRSALSLDNAVSVGPSQPKRTSSSHIKKPEGISRELYSLIGPSAPTLAAQPSKPRLKLKPNLGIGTRTKWEWRSFENSGRTDGLALRHWVKANSDPNTDYPFAKYNVQPANYTYSQDEYMRFLEDREWTKEETDYLFSLVRDFDSRWYIIHDRYDYPGRPPRMLEDLKDRYYSVCRKLVRNRPWAGDEASKVMLLSSFQFDKERELTRKKYLASLENRTPEQVIEEEALYLEIKKLEQNERRFKWERDDLLRLLAGIDSGLPEITEDDVTSLGQLPAVDSMKKKKKGTLESESPATPSASSISAPVLKRPQPTKNVAFDAQNCIIRTELPNTTSATKAAHQPAYLRSFKLPVPKAAIAPKVTQALAELGISHTRLVMPTRDNVAQLESLLEATMALIEMKRVVDKVDYDIRALRTQLGLKDGQDDEVKAEGMEVDESVIDGEAGERAQSVASTRSGRGSRKQSRRSMSVSSVDTSTRPNTKRQKRS
ncbi:SWR1-complex protein 4 [Leucoagaricus sp. SymC.cos]|nr:SWR1-complex protein 4 [Leucoagaricus sp. SymC.cos]